MLHENNKIFIHHVISVMYISSVHIFECGFKINQISPIHNYVEYNFPLFFFRLLENWRPPKNRCLIMKKLLPSSEI
jgi:hypothetical protein